MHPQYRGQDIPIITVPPDWDEAPIVTSRHKTIVAEALDLSEERLGMFPRPLYGIRYQTTTLTARESGYLRKLFELSQGLPVGCPFWSDGVALVSDAPTDSVSLTVSSTANRLFSVLNTHALLWLDFETWEVVALAAVLGDTVTLTSPTVRAFHAGALLLPLAFGHVRRPDGNNLNTETSSVLIEFNEVFSSIAPVQLTPGRLSATALAAWEALKHFDGAPQFTPGVSIRTAEAYDDQSLGTFRGNVTGLVDRYQIRAYNSTDSEYLLGTSIINQTNLTFDQDYPDTWTDDVSGLSGLVANFDQSRVELYNVSDQEYLASVSNVFIAALLWDQNYDYEYTGAVSGQVIGLPVEQHAEYEVWFWCKTDIEYFKGVSVIAPDGTFSFATGGNGEKIAKLIRKSDGSIRGRTGTQGAGSFFCPNGHAGYKLAKLVRHTFGVVALTAPPDNAVIDGTSALLQADVNFGSGAVSVDFVGAEIPDADDFYVILLPDTQIYSYQYPEIFTAQTNWIKSAIQSAGWDIVYVGHLGDLVHHYDSLTEWSVAQNAMRVLDGVVPYGVLPGNHDIEGVDDTNYNTHFPASYYSGNAWWGGSFSGKNNCNWQRVTRAGVEWIFLNLPHAPSDVELEWARGVAKAHPDSIVVLGSHAYLHPDGIIRPEESTLLTQLVRLCPNITLTNNGHYHGQGRLAGSLGIRLIASQVVDYQDDSHGGYGFLRILKFRPRLGRIEATSYSPYLDEFKTDGANQFNLDLRFRASFIISHQDGVQSPATNVQSTWLGLVSGKSYMWWVVATDADGHSERSTVRHLTVA